MRPLTQHAVRERLYHIKQSLVPQWERIGKDQRIQQIFDKWRPIINKIKEESLKRPEVVISLVGGTGSGKSTLLNALLDNRILPVSNMRACTAALTEVGYSEDGIYHAEIAFMSRKDWQKEFEILKEDIKDYIELQKNSEDESKNITEDVYSIPRIAKDKLKVIYNLPDNFEYQLQNLDNLKEDPEISRALDGEIVSFSEKDIKEFKKKISLYLDSKHKFWPIVTKVSIRGPFEILKDGIKLVDLPGINDPNQARESVTHNYLKTCNFVWIVFNIKRVITKDTMALMQSDDFMRQILMDGRAHALTFVGTASDDIDIDTAREEFALDDDVKESDIVLQRNKEVRIEVKKQLEELAGKLVYMAKEDKSKYEQLVETLKNSKIFTVSAHEYMRLKGYSRSKSIILEQISETEIDALRHHLVDISKSYGIEAQAKSHHRQIDLFISEVERETYLCIENLEKKFDLTQRQRKEVEAAVNSAGEFLQHDLRNIQENYKESLENSQKVLQERLERGFERGRYEMTKLSLRWQMMHWATLRAVARRGGRFVGSSGTYDFSSDISEPILNTIMFAWTDFFGQQLSNQIENVSEKLLKTFNKYLTELLTKTTKIIDLEKDVYDSFEKMFSTSEAILKEITGQIKTEMMQRIEKTQRTLYEQISGQIDANMQEGYQRAAEEHGKGMRMRMVDILRNHAESVSSTMFDDARQNIHQGLRSLCDYLLKRYDDMKETVLRQSRIATANLSLDAETLPPKDISMRKQGYEQVLAILKSI